jgi:flagellar biosynthesis/type III secretory pathway ATPase
MRLMPTAETRTVTVLATADGMLATKLAVLLAAGRLEAAFRDRGEASLKG